MSKLLLFLFFLECLFGLSVQQTDDLDAEPNELVIAQCVNIDTTVNQVLQNLVTYEAVSSSWIENAEIVTQSYTHSLGESAVYIPVDRTQTFHFIQTTSSATRIEIHMRVLLRENTVIFMDSQHSTL